MKKQTSRNLNNDNLVRDTRNREERLADLIGRYVIQEDSPQNPRQAVFFQDRSLCDHRFWTVELDQAQGFDTEKAANRMLRHLRFNNPRIVKVTEDLCACA